MAKVRRVSPLKPGLTGARNWATAQLRAANYSRRGFWRLTLSILAIFFAILFLGLWLGGFLPEAQKSSKNFMKNRLMSMGFVVERVDIMGEGALSERDIRRAVGVNPGDYLFELDLKAAQNNIENITWVERAIVRRLWPDRIVVQVIERKPYALWQNNGGFYLVDKKGEVISTAGLENHPELPLVTGVDAPAEYFEFRTQLADYPELSSQISSYVYHTTKRWDIILRDGKRVKLPGENTKDALNRLKALQNHHKLLDREFEAMDLRLPDRIVITPKLDEPA